MHFSLPARFAALAVAAVAASTVTMMAPAQAATFTTTIRPGDLNTSDTRTTGHNDFLKDGLHVYTEGSTSSDKAAGYFAYASSLANVASAPEPNMQWFGTTADKGGDCHTGCQPSIQLAFDKDGDGDWDGILVGEKIYGGNWWGSNANLQSDAASPHVGGGGSTANGTLADWSAAFPKGNVLYAGYSLGSGAFGDGVIKSMTIGDQNFEFTNQAAAATPETRDVTGSQVTTRYGVHHNRVKVVMSSAKQQANTTEGKRLQWRVVVDGHTAFKTSQGFGDRDVFTRGFHMGTGKHTLQVTKNGAVVKNVTVRSGQ